MNENIDFAKENEQKNENVMVVNIEQRFNAFIAAAKTLKKEALASFAKEIAKSNNTNEAVEKLKARFASLFKIKFEQLFDDKACKDNYYVKARCDMLAATVYFNEELQEVYRDDLINMYLEHRGFIKQNEDMSCLHISARQEQKFDVLVMLEHVEKALSFTNKDNGLRISGDKLQGYCMKLNSMLETKRVVCFNRYLANQGYYINDRGNKLETESVEVKRENDEKNISKIDAASYLSYTKGNSVVSAISKVFDDDFVKQLDKDYLGYVAAWILFSANYLQLTHCADLVSVVDLKFLNWVEKEKQAGNILGFSKEDFCQAVMKYRGTNEATTKRALGHALKECFAS